MSNTVLLIGCGNMGFAMLRGWLGADPDLRAFVVEPAEELRARAAEASAVAVGSITELPGDLAPDLVVLAVKPAMVAKVLAECGGFAGSATFVSVAAGITMPTMAAALPEGARIIRCMPNTPAAIGEGMLVLCAGEGVSIDAKLLTETLFKTSGAVTWVAEEGLMDAVTAISGSGPAYVFLFIEELTKAGMSLGLPHDTAALLAMQTVAGAGRYAQTSETPPGTLREQVTSPNGTTEAALNVFMGDDRMGRLVRAATEAARDRGIELGKGG